MKNQIASDLHLEREPRDSPRLRRVLAESADALVLAGDITSASRLAETLSQFCDRFAEVVYVLGNHEYYGQHVDSVHERMATTCARLRNLHWLHGNAETVAGTRFVGGTLWYPRTASPLRHIFPDFLLIRSFQPWLYDEHEHMRQLLAASKAEVLVTHHAPSSRSASEHAYNRKWEPFFVGDVEDALPNVQLAIHGHYHHRSDYNIGQTRVVCHPRGKRALTVTV